jgi:hypothetical protein
MVVVVVMKDRGAYYCYELKANKWRSLRVSFSSSYVLPRLVFRATFTTTNE